MNLKLNNNKFLLKYLLDNTNMAIAKLTKDFRIKEYNKGFEKLLGFPDNISDSLFEEVVGKIKITSENKESENMSIAEITCLYKNKAGSTVHLQGSLIKREDEIIVVIKNFLLNEANIVNELSKMNIEMSNLARELTKKNFQLKQASEKSTKLINTDFLTGIANRKYFFERLEELISSKKRSKGLAIGVIFIDIDFFKRFNDNYGHDKGDDVLIKFAEMLRGELRKEDIVARIGGEEFCVIVQCEVDTCLFEIAEKLRKSTEAMVIEDVNEKITASFGATYYKEWEDADSVVKRADENMYLAKENGRNQTVFK